MKQLEDGETWCRLNKKQQHVRIIDWLLVNVKIVEFYITRSKKLYAQILFVREAQILFVRETP